MSYTKIEKGSLIITDVGLTRQPYIGTLQNPSIYLYGSFRDHLVLYVLKGICMHARMTTLIRRPKLVILWILWGATVGTTVVVRGWFFRRCVRRRE